MVEAQTPHRVHFTSIWYAWKVFQHLDMLLMGIWVHPYSVMPVFQHLDMLLMGIWVHPYSVMPVQVGGGFLVSGFRGRSEPEWYDVMSWLRLMGYACARQGWNLGQGQGQGLTRGKGKGNGKDTTIRKCNGEKPSPPGHRWQQKLQDKNIDI